MLETSSSTLTHYTLEVIFPSTLQRLQQESREVTSEGSKEYKKTRVVSCHDKKLRDFAEIHSFLTSRIKPFHLNNVILHPGLQFITDTASFQQDHRGISPIKPRRSRDS